MALFVVDTIVQFRHKYVIEGESLEHAYDEVTMRDSGCNADEFDEVTQRYLGETILDGREISKEEFDTMIEALGNDPREVSSHYMGDKIIHKINYETAPHLDYMNNFPDRVTVFKNGTELGWFKDVEHGRNAIIATCEVHGFDISEYEFYNTNNELVWTGK